jgi:hypothetical protein
MPGTAMSPAMEVTAIRCPRRRRMWGSAAITSRWPRRRRRPPSRTLPAAVSEARNLLAEQNLKLGNATEVESSAESGTVCARPPRQCCHRVLPGVRRVGDVQHPRGGKRGGGGKHRVVTQDAGADPSGEDTAMGCDTAP